MIDLTSGKTQAGPLVELCRVLQATGRGGGGVDLIANIGGRDRKHANKDIVKLCQGLYGSTLSPVWVPLRMREVDGSVRERACRVVLPFDVFGSMHKLSPLQFKRSMLPERDAPERYWSALAEGVDHHVNTDPAWSSKRARTVPLFYHSDGVQIYQKAPEPMSIVSFSSALVCFPLYYAALSACQGDGKEKVIQNRYDRHYNCNYLCELCMGNRHRHFCSAYDFGEQAQWRSTITTMHDYLATRVGVNRSPWCRMRSWSIFRWLPDLLHLVWLAWHRQGSAGL